jgi:periplasmic protein TonB
VTRNTIPAIENQIDKSKAISSPMESWAPVTMRTLASVAREKALFEDSLLDSTVGQRQRRTLSAFSSFILQCLVIGFVLLLPLWFTEVLPKEQLVTLLVAPPPPPPSPPPASTPPASKVVKVTSNIANGRLRTPSRIPAKVRMIKDDEAPPPTITGGVVGGVPGGIPGGQSDGVIGGIIGSTSSLAAAPTLFKPKPVMPTVQRVRVSPGVIKGLLIHRVEPIYPPLAQQARIQGVVVLSAIIDKDGNVQRLQVVSGHPLLAPAAIAAVKQWRYKPFFLNGQPLEVETTVTVNFHVQSE